MWEGTILFKIIICLVKVVVKVVTTSPPKVKVTVKVSNTSPDVKVVVKAFTTTPPNAL